MIYKSKKEDSPIYHTQPYIEPKLRENPIQWQWWDERPINWKSQVYNRYLDWAIFYWAKAVTWIDITDNINSTDTWIRVPLNLIKKIWKYDRKVDAWWGIVFPVNWTFSVTMIWIYYPYVDSALATEFWISQISEATAEWQYWLKPLVPSYVYVPAWWTSSDWVFWFIKWEVFWTLFHFASYTEISNSSVGETIYACASHKWVSTNIPVRCYVSISKLS